MLIFALANWGRNVCSFFGRIEKTKKLFRNSLTFIINPPFWGVSNQKKSDFAEHLFLGSKNYLYRAIFLREFLEFFVSLSFGSKNYFYRAIILSQFLEIFASFSLKSKNFV